MASVWEKRKRDWRNGGTTGELGKLWKKAEDKEKDVGDERREDKDRM